MSKKHTSSSEDQNPTIRLQKYIADCGITSRRSAENYILEGRVQVNGEVVTVLGTKVDPENDVVMVDDRPVDPKAVTKVYLVLNKPRGYLTTLNDPEGRRTVMDLIKFIPERIYPVGRLDYLSEGLLLMTNDGEVANLVMHPRHNITKIYEVKVFGAVNFPLLKKIQAGVEIDGEMIRPSSVRVVEQLPTKTWLEFRLAEGKNREIRKICEAHGITIDKLRRVAIEGLHIQGIAPGKCIFLTKKELYKYLGIDHKGNKIETPKFISAKKTIDVFKKGALPGTSANDRAFRIFKKETYYQTVQSIKEKATLSVPTEEIKSEHLSR